MIPKYQTAESENSEKNVSEKMHTNTLFAMHYNITLPGGIKQPSFYRIIEEKLNLVEKLDYIAKVEYVGPSDKIKIKDIISGEIDKISRIVNLG